VTKRNLDDLLARCPASVQALAKSARTFLLKALPGAEESIDESAPVIGYGYGPGYKGLICTLLVSKSGVKLGLAHGAKLPDPERLLEGAGKVHKFVHIRTAADLRKASLTQLVKAASASARARSG